MLTGIELYLAAQAAGLVFKPILEELAKGAAEDWAKDFCKESLKGVFSRGDGPKAAARALKEFLQAFEGELVGAGAESEAERKSYTEDLKKFVKLRDVRQALGAVLEEADATVDAPALAALWAQQKLKALPDDFRWSAVGRLYQNKARSILLEFPDLRDEINAANAQKTSAATQRMAGVAPGFDTERYRQGLLDRYQNLKLHDLESGGAIHDPMHLTKIFVEQNVRDCQQFNPRVHELPRDHVRALREQGAAGEELAAAEMEQLRRAFFDQSPRGVLEALRDPGGRLCVVLGDPGSGKSVLLEYLALSWAGLGGQARDAAPLPLLIELKAYARHRARHGSVLEYLHHAPDGCGQLDQNELHQHLERHGGLLLLDGLDEIFDETVRASVVLEIANLARRYPRARCVVTSRVIGYQQQTLSDAEFRHFMLQDLEPAQIEDFIQRWHDLAYADAAERVLKRERLRQAVARSTAIRELAGNPLLLTMMALLNRHQELPRDRTRLYDQATRLLLYQWDASRALPEDALLAGKGFDAEDKQAMLRAVAAKMQTGEQGLAGNAIAARELKATLTAHLRPNFQEPTAIAARLIEQLRERNFILCLLGGDLFAFVHRTFLEYFCAADFLWKFEKDRTLTLEELQAQTFEAHWWDEKWHEVLRLIAGQLQPQFAGQLIESLLDKEDPTNEQTHLFLAAQCLGEVRNRSALSALDARLLEALKPLTRFNLPSKSFYKHKARQLILDVRIGAVSAIASTWAGLSSTKNWLQERARSDEDWRVRSTAVQELAHGWHDDPATLPWLQECAHSDENRDVRNAAVRELARGWHDDPATLPLLQKLARSDEDGDVQSTAMRELVRGWHDDPATLPLLQKLARSDEPWSVRRVAVQELARGWHDDPATLLLLQEFARSHKRKHSGLWQTAYNELALGWNNDPTVQAWLAELEELENEPSPD